MKYITYITDITELMDVWLSWPGHTEDDVRCWRNPAGHVWLTDSSTFEPGATRLEITYERPCIWWAHGDER